MKFISVYYLAHFGTSQSVPKLEASRVVAGGRGLKNGENFEKVTAMPDTYGYGTYERFWKKRRKVRAALHSKREGEQHSTKSRSEIRSLVCSVGSGMVLEVLEPLCDKLKAALGASRAAVDAGFVPNELQVPHSSAVLYSSLG